jgi:hypothetical protein
MITGFGREGVLFIFYQAEKRAAALTNVFVIQFFKLKSTIKEKNA